MTDDVVVSSDTFDRTAHLRLTNVTPALTIDVVAHHRHATLSQTCTHAPFSVQ